MKKLKLKTPKKSGEYDSQICAVVKCNKISEVIDATKKISSKDVPLCSKHWSIRANMIKILTIESEYNSCKKKLSIMNLSTD